jgi:RNA-binding protein YlmH
METKNKRKVTGAIVWHENELKVITNQNVGKEHRLLNNLTKVKKSSIRLAKIGDAVKYKDLSVLPERCATVSDMKITYFRSNGIVGIVGTDKDLYPTSDGSAYGHFVRG